MFPLFVIAAAWVLQVSAKNMSPRQGVVHSLEHPIKDGTDKANHVCDIPKGEENKPRNNFHFRGPNLGKYSLLYWRSL